VKCMVCEAELKWGAISISTFLDEIYTINICQRCRHKLLGAEIDDRVTRLIRLKSWVQPRLPTL